MPLRVGASIPLLYSVHTFPCHSGERATLSGILLEGRTYVDGQRLYPPWSTRTRRERGDASGHRKWRGSSKAHTTMLFFAPSADMQRYAIGLWVPAFARTTGKELLVIRWRRPRSSARRPLCQPDYSGQQCAKAGIHRASVESWSIQIRRLSSIDVWIPAFAGRTGGGWPS
jgi:hypothetical protein